VGALGAARRRLTRRAWVVLAVLALLVSIVIYKALAPTPADKKIAAYCKTVRIGHTVLRNPYTVIGPPDSRNNVTLGPGVEMVVLRYGRTRFFFERASTRLVHVEGC
jgi:hypothetical protein